MASGLKNATLEKTLQDKLHKYETSKFENNT